MHAYLLITQKDPLAGSLKSLISSEFKRELTYSVKTIAEVRDLKKSFLFSPTESTLVILTNVDEAKHEAQNALLKLLEEPPSDNIVFVVTAKQEDLLIPTIVSRLTKITSKDIMGSQSNNVDQFIEHSPSSWFEPFSHVSDREEAIKVFQSLLSRGGLTTAQNEAALKAISDLKKNTSVPLTLTNFILVDLPN